VIKSIKGVIAMNLNQLYYFQKLAELQHFTKAAEALFISQPSLTYSIKSLEKELNTPLFEKKGRNVVLTKYGQTFYEYVNRSIGELEAGAEIVKNYGSPMYGVVDLAFIYTMGHKFIPKLVSSFSKIEGNEHITFNLEQNTSREVVNLLKEGKCDIAISSFINEEKTLRFKEIAEEELVLIVPKDHPLAKHKKIDLRETRAYPYIAYSETSGLYSHMKKLFEDSGFEPIVKCRIQEDHTIFGFVENNYGIAVVPKLSTISSFNIVPISIEKPVIKRSVYLVTSKDRKLAPAPQKFLEYIQKSCLK